MQSVEGLSRWEELRPPLSPCCLEAVKALGFSSMTPVQVPPTSPHPHISHIITPSHPLALAHFFPTLQSATIPYFVQNKDVAVEAVSL